MILLSFFKSNREKAEKGVMKALILIFSLCFIDFVFSNQPSESKNLLENNLLKESQPTQDLLEVVGELEGNDRSVTNERQVSLQLKDTSRTDARQLAQIPESPQSDDSDQSESHSEIIKEINPGDKDHGEGNTLQSLIHESVFQKEHAKRDLDVYVEDRKDLSLEDVEVQEDFGNVEIRWKPPEDLD